MKTLNFQLSGREVQITTGVKSEIAIDDIK